MSISVKGKKIGKEKGIELGEIYNFMDVPTYAILR